MEFGHPAGTWPGDAPLERQWTARIGDGGGGVNLTRFCSSPHNGTHSDAPVHVDDAGGMSESLPLQPYLGPCRVVDAAKVSEPEIPAALALPALRAGNRRVLFRTRVGPLPDAFPRGFRGLSLGLAKRLAEGGVELVGTDAPSIDPFDSKGLRAHKALFAAGAVLLENLDLSDAPPGDYELAALPLKVRGLCAAPVRAVLRPRSREGPRRGRAATTL